MTVISAHDGECCPTCLEDIDLGYIDRDVGLGGKCCCKALPDPSEVAS